MKGTRLTQEQKERAERYLRWNDIDSLAELMDEIGLHAVPDRKHFKDRYEAQRYLRAGRIAVRKDLIDLTLGNAGVSGKLDFSGEIYFLSWEVNCGNPFTDIDSCLDAEQFLCDGKVAIKVYLKVDSFETTEEFSTLTYEVIG